MSPLPHPAGHADPERAGLRPRAARRGSRLLALLVVLAVWLVAAAAAATADLAGRTAASLTAAAPGGACDPAPAVTLAPEASTAQVGTAHGLTGTVTGRRAGTLDVVVIEGPHEGTALSVTRSGGGFQARYTGQERGTDVVEARLTVGGEVADRQRARVTWTSLSPPQLSQADDVSDVGSRHEVAVLLPRGQDGEVAVAVLRGPHAGEQLEVTGTGMRRTASYVGTRPGVDVLQASVRSGGTTSLSNELRHTWRPVPVLRAEPERSAARVDAVQSVRIIVEGADGSGVMTAEVVEGVHEGLDLEVVQESSSAYTARYVGRVPGTDTVRATLTRDGQTYLSNPVTRVWQPPVRLELGPTGTSSPLGTTHTLTVTASGSTSVRPVLRVVDGPNRGQEVPLSGSGGRYTGTYRSPQTGQDTLQAALPGTGITSGTATHTWTEVVRNPTVAIVSDSGPAFVGGPYFVVLRVENTDVPPEVRVVEGPNQGRSLAVRDEQGRWVAGYSSRVEGVDTLLATVPRTNAADRATVEWTAITDPDLDPDPDPDPDPVPVPVIPDRGPDVIGAPLRPEPALTAGSPVALGPVVLASLVTPAEDCLDVQVAPRDASSQVTIPLTLTATVRDDRGQPVTGAEVEFRATLPGAAPLLVTRTTTGNGVATWQHTRQVPGTESIDVTVTSPLGSDSASTTHTWLPVDGLTVTLSPGGTVSPVGSPFTAIATVRDTEGNPVEGVVVRFRAELATAGDLEVDDIELTAATGPLGRARFPYLRHVAGTDTVTALAQHDGREAQASMSHVWESVPGLGLQLEPAGTTTEVGDEFTTTALVTVDGEPRAGAEVAFTAEMPLADELEQTVLTDDDGLASWTYSREEPGDEVVSATATAGGRSASNAMEHGWVLPSGLDVALEPDGTSSDIGEPFTATVTVTEDGTPVEGATVELTRSIAGESPVIDPPVQTQDDGRGQVTWSRDVPGLEQVVAVVRSGDRRAEAAMSHEWLSDESVGPLVEVVGGGSMPGAPVTVVGRGCPPGLDVDLRLAAEEIGEETAGPDGSYEARARVPDTAAVGRHELLATCGPVAASAPLDVVVTSSSTGTAGAAVTTVAAVLTFFVLLGAQLVRVASAGGGGGGGTS